MSKRVRLLVVKVLLDTNMILLIADGVNVKENIESIIESKADFLCPESVVKELEEITKSKKEGWRKAQWALINLHKICEKTKSIEETADSDILLLADEIREQGYEVIVATNDKELRRKLRQKGFPTAYLVESEMRVESDYD
ncbi:MAG: hypothetical protein QW604_00985 [Fervidicoccaceae archaeon]